MVVKNILVTGGAGFIGSFLVDQLVKNGHNVRILDNLEEQVHQGKTPAYLNEHAEFIQGDVRNYDIFMSALNHIDTVVHLASRVGVGQSNYEIKNYTDVNIGGIRNLLDILVNKKNNVQKIIMTASMTSYGEGSYICKTHNKVRPNLRTEQDIKKFGFEPVCPVCHKKIKPIAINEEQTINNSSIYSLTKDVQEKMLLMIGKMYKIPAVSLRCFNVYGPRQSLSNPYTGVSAIFISRLKNNHQPVIYEDGLQTRDFVSVHDVVNAIISTMNSQKADYQTFNIGSGKQITIKTMAEVLAKLLKKNIQPDILNQYRKNDIRHCFADISKAKKLFDWQPVVSLENGLQELIAWSEDETAQDLFEKAENELRNKDLL